MSCHPKYFLSFIFVTLFLWIPIVEISAQRKLDSLQQVLEDELLPRDRILTHNRIARIYMNKDTALALQQRDAMDSLSIVHNDTLGRFLVEALNNIYYYKLSDYASAEGALKRQMALAQMMNNENFMTGLNYELSLVKQAQNELDSAIYYAEVCFDMIKINPKVPMLNKVLTLNHLGQLSEKQNEYAQALRYYFIADSLADNVDNYQVTNYHGDVKLSIGTTYLRLKDTLSAKAYYHQGLQKYQQLENYKGLSQTYLKIGDLYRKQGRDSSLYFSNEGLNYAERVGEQMLIASASNQIGDYWSDQEENEKALGYYNTAYNIYAKANRESRIANTGMRMAKLEEQQGRYVRALQLVEEVSPYYVSSNSLEGQYAVAYSKAGLLEKLGRYKDGLTSMQLAYDLKDSLNSVIYNTDVSDLKIKYETSVKDKEIQEQRFLLEREEDRRIRLLIGMSLLILIGFMMFWFMRKRMSYNRKIAKQNELIQSQKIEELEKEKKILSMSAMIEGQEAERTRIAKDLHDGLGGLLSTVKAHFSNIQSEIQKVEKLNVYHRAHEMMDEACDEVRRISHNLMPGALRLEGLPEALRHLGEEMDAAHAFAVSVEVIGCEERMDESKEVFLYRIVQEALNNIIKHAHAKQVLIQLSETESEYHIIIEDDGQGFDPLAIQSGLGLKSIQSRVDYLKGTLDMDTQPGVGTSLTIHIPKV